MLTRFEPLLRTWRWPALALVLSLAMLATAHGFERFGVSARSTGRLRRCQPPRWCFGVFARTGVSC